MLTRHVGVKRQHKGVLPDSDSQLLTEEIYNGEQFTQTRTCNDFNNCGIEEGKPIKSQQSIGTKDCSNSISTPSASE